MAQTDKKVCINCGRNRSDTGTVSAELNSIYQAGFMGFLGGAVYGGFIRSRLAYLEFMENNQATAFKSHFEAKVSSNN